MANAPTLRREERSFVGSARTAVLATTAPDGRPRLVPICFAVLQGAGATPVLVSPLDEKPKSTADPHALGRVRDVLARPAVTLLVDRWSEDWERLAWVRLEARAAVVEPGGADHGPAVAALRAKYPQYATHRLEERPLLRFAVERVVSWGDLAGKRSAGARGTAPERGAGGSGSSSSPGGSRRR